MKIFRSLKAKLIIALVLTALVPLIPLTLVVKHLIEKSLEVGLNEQADDAIESALELARENYSFRKETVITQAELIANLYDVRKPFIDNNRRTLQINVVQWSDDLRLQAIELYDDQGNFVLEAISPDIAGYKNWETQTDQVLKALKVEEAYVPELENEKVVKAFAKVHDYHEQIIGVVVVTQIIEPAYAEARRKVREGFETYQYLDLIKGHLTVNFLRTFLLFAIIIGFIGTFVGVLITRRITNSITELVRGTEELAKGNLDYEVKANGKDEIASLVDAFNTMAKTMKDNRKKLLRSERLAAWRDVARRIAHEIKNPLTPIQLSVQHLTDKYYENDQNYEKILSECTDTISEEVESLRTMVESFSEFAKMPKPEFEPTNINSLIDSFMQMYAETREDVTFTTNLSQELPELNVDPEQIKRVFHNLIKNALDAIPQNGEIVITTEKVKNKAIIRIFDTGKQISQKDLDKIFEPYFTTKSKGSGLGLAIVKRIIRDHFGDITFHKKENGKEFIINLPINK